jgi:hypothetical protein
MVPDRIGYGRFDSCPPHRNEARYHRDKVHGLRYLADKTQEQEIDIDVLFSANLPQVLEQ